MGAKNLAWGILIILLLSFATFSIAFTTYTYIIHSKEKADCYVLCGAYEEDDCVRDCYWNKEFVEDRLGVG